jgi:SAM-dependent methyltransferase
LKIFDLPIRYQEQIYGTTYVNLLPLNEYIGVDRDDPIRQYEKPFNVFLKQGTLFCLPYEDNFYNTVLLVSILEHLQPDDRPIAFREIGRVLKPGGQVVYGIPVDSKMTRFGDFTKET